MNEEPYLVDRFLKDLQQGWRDKTHLEEKTKAIIETLIEMHFPRFWNKAKAVFAIDFKEKKKIYDLEKIYKDLFRSTVKAHILNSEALNDEELAKKIFNRFIITLFSYQALLGMSENSKKLIAFAKRGEKMTGQRKLKDDTKDLYSRLKKVIEKNNKMKRPLSTKDCVIQYLINDCDKSYNEAVRIYKAYNQYEIRGIKKKRQKK